MEPDHGQTSGYVNHHATLLALPFFLSCYFLSVQTIVVLRSLQASDDISDLTQLVLHSRSTNSQPIVTYPFSVGFRDMCSAFAPQFASSFASSFAPPLLNFSGCSINVYTGPVMTSENFHHSNMFYFELTPDDLENFC